MAWKIEVHFPDGNSKPVTNVKTKKKAKKEIRAFFKKGVFIENNTHVSYYPPRAINKAEANGKDE